MARKFARRSELEKRALTRRRSSSPLKTHCLALYLSMMAVSRAPRISRSCKNLAQQGVKSCRRPLSSAAAVEGSALSSAAAACPSHDQNREEENKSRKHCLLRQSRKKKCCPTPFPSFTPPHTSARTPSSSPSLMVSSSSMSSRTSTCRTTSSRTSDSSAPMDSRNRRGVTVSCEGCIGEPR